MPKGPPSYYLDPKAGGTGYEGSSILSRDAMNRRRVIHDPKTGKNTYREQSKDEQIAGRAAQFNEAGFNIPTERVNAVNTLAGSVATPDAVAGQQRNLSDLLFAGATGQAPSAAETLLGLGHAQAGRQQMSLAAGARGSNAAAYRAAGRNMAMMSGDLNAQMAAQRAEEQERARQALIQHLYGQRAQNQAGLVSAGQLQLGLGELQGNQSLQLLNVAQGVQAARDAQTAARADRITGGVTNTLAAVGDAVPG